MTLLDWLVLVIGWLVGLGLWLFCGRFSRDLYR